MVGGSDIALPCEMFLVGDCLQVNFLRTAVHQAQPHFLHLCSRRCPPRASCLVLPARVCCFSQLLFLYLSAMPRVAPKS